MCNNYTLGKPIDTLMKAFEDLQAPLAWEDGVVRNLPVLDNIRIRDEAPVVRRIAGAATLSVLPWAWAAPNGRPVFNFRSEGRSFANVERVLIPADSFFEFTDPAPGSKRKTRLRFTMTDAEVFWIAGLVRDGAFAMLTTSPGPDMAPHHDRQIVLLRSERALDWLDLLQPEAELLAPSPKGTLVYEDATAPELQPKLF